MKTLECKLYLKPGQKQHINQWLEVQRWVWNAALELLQEFENFAAYNPHDKQYAPCCPVPWQYRYAPLKKETEWRSPEVVASFPAKDKQRTTYVPIPFSQAGIGKIGKFRQACPIPQTYVKPRLDRDSQFSLEPFFANKRNQDNEKLIQCPSALTLGTVKLLSTAWDEYKKGRLKAPKFKGRGQNHTLTTHQGKSASTIDDSHIRLPKLGKVKVRGLKGRLPADLPIKSYRICKRPSGYFLLLVVDVPQNQTITQPDHCVGIDPGIAAGYACSDGRVYRVPPHYQSTQKTLRRFQRKLQRQTKGSANYQKTLSKVQKLHEKIKQQRKARNHEVSSILTQRYGAIALEDNALQNMTRRPKKQLREDGKGYKKNRAKQKAGLNKALLNVGIGQFKQLLKEKTTAKGSEFALTPAHHNSQTCNQCGHIAKENRRSQSKFQCVSCGHTENADINAAKNVIDRSGLPTHYTKGTRPSPAANQASTRRYPALAGKFKPVKDSRHLATESVQQESAQAEPLEQTREPSPKGHLRRREKPKIDRSAQAELETQVQLSLWLPALETKAETS